MPSPMFGDSGAALTLRQKFATPGPLHTGQQRDQKTDSRMVEVGRGISDACLPGAPRASERSRWARSGMSP